jgi:hypothetical protein
MVHCIELLPPLAALISYHRSSSTAICSNRTMPVHNQTAGSETCNAEQTPCPDPMQRG